MAENGVNGHSKCGTEWKVGFMNPALKYLTAETFGYKVNSSGPALKKKQIWVIEQDFTDNCVYIRSHLKRYMTSDKYGTVSVEAEEREDDAKFVVEYSSDGRWAFKHVTHRNYLSGVDEVKCFEKTTSEKTWWSIQLYVHPQINLRNSGRKRYAHLNKENNTIECTEDIPWGADSQIFLDFVEGKYTLKSCDNRYMNRDGTLQDNIDDNATYTMEVHQGCLAFKDVEGRYLTTVGTNALVKGRNKTITKDELFTIEDSHPQVQIISPNGKSVSVKQGVDVSANQIASCEEIDDTEIFQLEFCKESETWAIRASTGKYWNLQTSGTVQATSPELKKDGHFSIEWQEDGSVGIKGSDGKYLANKPTGVMFSATDKLEDSNKYRINIVNRPLLVLKSEFGFVGLKGTQFICNKAKYDVISVIPKGDGSYHLKGQYGNYFGVSNDSTIVAESSPTDFQFQFCGRSEVAIKAPNKCYLKGEQNGLFKANTDEIIPSALWEF